MERKGIKKRLIILKDLIIECDKTYFRPLRCKYFNWRCKKAKKKLKWKPSYNLNSLIDEMIASEYQKINDKSKKKIYLAGHNGDGWFGYLQKIS
jgi:GDP-D-mannose dehydratase